MAGKLKLECTTICWVNGMCIHITFPQHFRIRWRMYKQVRMRHSFRVRIQY